VAPKIGEVQGIAKLRIWLDGSTLTRDAFADRIGVTRASIFHWLCGRYQPNLATAMKIESFTAGAVPAASWVPYVGKRRQIKPAES
jgi:DNA-binding XRE family transcriptional regulator